ncbi:hypothetical protein P22_0071 [Propionispora sp. 2/2-37]|uniref:cobalt-precorrin 5A hydrolase n=1 Tax=Propionispora sp. 2/2-37 TaxID=1677858 RepID=UPI0006BB886D|nr:cobalt-precorrin 5A hydrolase [Propionispora sp. 2/2-37]CUH94009.1 hypothetical protein P22_0071 [Propionispora sp. 2/2-37]
MKIAVISVTRRGACLAERIAGGFPGSVNTYTKNGRGLSTHTEYFDSLGELVREIFSKYDGLVFIMATGIAVRVIAPYIRDKRRDPAVVVVDDNGCHAISLLSGHLGGANALTEKISRCIGARPVITTATDLAQKTAPDILAKKLGFTLEPFACLKTVNAALANGDRVAFFLDGELLEARRIGAAAQTMEIECIPITELARQEAEDRYDAAVLLTDKNVNSLKPHIYLRPRTLAVGIGCRRGTPEGEIMKALQDSLISVRRSLHSIAVIGSSIVKADEAGLLTAGEIMGIPLRFFTNEELQGCIDRQKLEISAFVKKQIGVGNVCEAAALLAAQSDKLLINKKKYGRVTVAMAEIKYSLLVSDREA